jgi:HEAT repeat protein
MIRTELSLVTVVLSAFGLWVIGMFALSLVRALAWQKKSRATQAHLPAIRTALVDYLSGNEDRTKLREFVQENREDAAAAVMSFEGTVGGSARERLCDLALELALVHEWCQQTRSRNAMERRAAYWRLAFVCAYEPCRRVAGDILLIALNDADEEVRLAAGNAIIYTGAIDDVERVFEHAIVQTQLNRIVLSEELRPFAVALCERAIPKVLKSGDTARIAGMLHMVVAWERAVPLPGIGHLLSAEDRSVRMLALQAAPLAQDAPEVRKGILDALVDPDPEIVVSAARAAGRLRLDAALPTLARLLRTGDAELARASASALGQIPPRGLVALQELTLSTSATTASAASEALTKAQGRL